MFNKDGFHHDQCDKIWPGYSSTTHKFLLELLYYFGIAVPTKGGKSLIPCRLPPTPSNVMQQKPFNGKVKRNF